MQSTSLASQAAPENMNMVGHVLPNPSEEANGRLASTSQKDADQNSCHSQCKHERWGEKAFCRLVIRTNRL
eukprot:scaffold88735_cov28-Tisochrysis_lutea.AAC.12